MPSRFQNLPVEVVVGSKRFVELFRNWLANGVLGEVEFVLHVVGPLGIGDVEVVVEETGQEIVAAWARANRELIKYAVVFLEFTEL